MEKHWVPPAASEPQSEAFLTLLLKLDQSREEGQCPADEFCRLGNLKLLSGPAIVGI